MSNGTTGMGGGHTELSNEIRIVARQLSALSQSIGNAQPAATTTTSPQATGSVLGTAAAVQIVGARTTAPARHGIMFHNPATTAAYIWPSGLTPAPTSSSLQGSLEIQGGSTITFSSEQWPNINSAFSGIATTGGAQPFSVWEWF
jgi:hypothetical protein